MDETMKGVETIPGRIRNDSDISMANPDLHIYHDWRTFYDTFDSETDSCGS